MNEEWRPVPGQEGRYEVSDQGRIRSLPRWRVPEARIRKPHVNDRGYLRVLVKVGGRGSKTLSLDVHRVVCHAFHGDPRPGDQARHLNGDKFDNRPANLAWGDYSDQRHDDVANGIHPMAKKTHCPQGHELGPMDPRRRRRRCPTCRRTTHLERAGDARRARAKVPAICPECRNPYSPNSLRRHRARKHGVLA